MPKVIFSTSRLSIEEVDSSDREFIYGLLNSPNWLEFIGDRGIRTLPDAEAYIKESLQKSYEQNGYGLYKMVLKSTMTPIGLCGFLNRDYLDNPDLGFAILPKYEAKGYTSEAALEMIHYGFNELGFPTINAITTRDNLKSQRLLLKLGLAEMDSINQEGVDYLVYSITSE